MANVIKTVLTYPLDGSTTDFNIPFEYLARKFVVVTLLGVDRRVLTLTADYRFATRTVIATNKAWGPADGYTQIEIRRVTSATERLVDFTDGSILRAYDLNVAQIQTMHVAEEARNMTADTIGVNNDGHLDARGRRIVNLAYATSDYDAVPLKQIKERESSAWNAVTRANEHADRSNKEANSSREEANRAQREADRSAQQAGVSTQQAVESKKQADRSSSEANRAKGYADGMTASVAEAKKQADRSGAEANRASDEANRAAGEVTKAAAEVAKAATHVETAKGHADMANIEADRSKGEADRAKAEADKLKNMNDFSGAITEVTPNRITFNRGVVTYNAGFRSMADPGKVPNVGVWRQGKSELNMTVDESGNTGFVGTVGTPWLGYWNPAKDTYVSTTARNYDQGGRQIRGALEVGHGNNSSILTSSWGESSNGDWACMTNYKWYGGGVQIGTVRGSSQDCNGLLRTTDGTIGKYMDYQQRVGDNKHVFYNRDGASVLEVLANGDMHMQWGGLLSTQIRDRSPKRWSWLNIGNIAVANDNSIGLPIDVRGLRGFFGFSGERGEIVYKPFTFPPLDGYFQLNRKGDWQVFQLSNNGKQLTRKYGWSEGGDPYAFYVEQPNY